jgi:protein SCO1
MGIEGGPTMRSRLLIAALVSLAVISAALATVIVHRVERPARAVTNGAALIGGPFSLVDDDGKRVTDRDFRGRWMLVYFGYTYCPDVCPLDLQMIAQAMDHLPSPVAGKVVPIFVTVDPERDTVPVLHEFVQLFHPDLVGLTGTAEEVQSVERAYRVYSRKARSDKDGSYSVDHSAIIYLMDPEGSYVTHFASNPSPEELATKISELVGATSSAGLALPRHG